MNLRIWIGAGLAAALLASGSPTLASPESTKQAVELLCEVLEGSNLLVGPCRASGEQSAVDAVMQKSPKEAQRLCGVIAKVVKEWEADFDKGWRLRIFAPAKGETPIATCPLI